MNKQNQIRDIIYGYIDITPFEEIIIEDPYFQRLRFIFQNSSAYLTYPSNQLTRFSHSLGVMHIGGQMFENGIRNANDNVKSEFLALSKDILIKRITAYEITSTYDQIKEYWEQNQDVFGKLGINSLTSEERFVCSIYIQSLRIACLCHDIGHLPFSHIFEMAIDDFNSRNNEHLASSLTQDCIQEIQKQFKTSLKQTVKATDLHELIGAYLLCSIFKSLPKEKKDIERDVFKLSLGLAIEMFLHEKRDYNLHEEDTKSLFSCFYSIISSDLDADRLDYILRDAKSSGINLGDFDYTRIIMHLELVKRGKAFTVIPSGKSISSIDQFFNYRYLMYEYVYYHHNVAKYDGLLIEIIGLIFKEIIIDNNAVLKKIAVESFKLIDTNNNIFPLRKFTNGEDIIAYDYYDDCWLRNLLQNLLVLNETSSIFVNNDLGDLIGTFLFRKKANSISWAKTSVQIDDYLSNEFFQKLVKSDPGFRLKYFIENNKTLKSESLSTKIDNIHTTINQLARDKQMTVLKDYFDTVENNDVPDLPLNNETRIKFRHYIKEGGGEKMMVKAKLNELRETLKEKGVILITKGLSPKLLSESQLILVKQTVVKPISEASFYLENLSNLSKTHFVYYFGFFKKDIKNSDEENEQLIKECSYEVSKFLFSIIDHGLLSSVNDKFTK